MRIKDNIASEFNEFSVNYTNDMIGCVPHYLKLMSSFIENIPAEFTPKNILDLGCGNGNTTSVISQLFPNAHYTLLDASEQMIALCSKRFNDFTVEYVTSYFKDFQFTADFYDMIAAGFSLHHCDSNEKKLLFQNIFKSLKKGGIFGCSDLMINTSTPEHIKLLEEWNSFVSKSFPDGEKWKWLMEHYNEFDKPDDYTDQIKWLEQVGFKNIQIITQENYWTHIRATKE
jgi:ubiquinone/menaquinone biosynthesis C-methylase UbiE